MIRKERASMAENVAGALRRGPLADHVSVSIDTAPASTRFIFRGSPEAARLCGNGFGCTLPLEACRANRGTERVALWLGPDEWLLLVPDSASPDDLVKAVGQALGDVPHSLVDVSHRQIGLSVSGSGVCDVLNAGCPLDLDLRAFPVDMATRTVLAKADITLWRQAEDRFRIEVNRSFAPYLMAFLREAERDLR
jgi:sarcosine oxidase, subunit gamma